MLLKYILVTSSLGIPSLTKSSQKDILSLQNFLRKTFFPFISSLTFHWGVETENPAWGYTDVPGSYIFTLQCFIDLMDKLLL
jgi:hypothetical protein